MVAANCRQRSSPKMAPVADPFHGRRIIGVSGRQTLTASFSGIGLRRLKGQALFIVCAKRAPAATYYTLAQCLPLMALFATEAITLTHASVGALTQAFAAVAGGYGVQSFEAIGHQVLFASLQPGTPLAPAAAQHLMTLSVPLMALGATKRVKVSTVFIHVGQTFATARGSGLTNLVHSVLQTQAMAVGTTHA